ncbi:MAG: RagB/SusD family nutrient uptake outer membrane protein [Dysgonamonadaceae bacterium]|nr:RagB/SusD family nutrient uptake outer membrane protein [Dysgonamonadaceae bacterium]
MKKTNFIKYVTIALLFVGFASCEDFLNRPDKSNYTLSDFFKTDEQCLQAINPLYSVPWNDFISWRGWIQLGDAMSGNYYIADNGFWSLTPNNGTCTDQLRYMSYSLWAVNARANTVIENIDTYAGEGTTEIGRNTAKGEALVWKALAYFYMVRIYGAVPIVHNNTELLGTGEYNTLYRATIPTVYDYIIKTLEQAIAWLPEKATEAGRIDKYATYGLLAKVYLTKSGYGRNGDRDENDLARAAEYAGKVVNESGRILMPEYSDIFRGHNNTADESLIAWRWVATGDNFWTASNYMQTEFVAAGFSEGEAWGNWTGPSLDLQAAFGETFDGTNPSGALSPIRANLDKRRKATMMMYSDVYEYFWRDHPTKEGADEKLYSFPGGFDWTKFYGDVLGDFSSSTGANAVKHIVGNDADHTAEFGIPLGGAAKKATSLATHILRLGDVYLIYAEAILGNQSSTSNTEALKAFNAVHGRAVENDERSSITWNDIFKERRLELAFEGDFWYDLVRWHYYKPDEALNFLKNQDRRNYVGLSQYYKDKGWERWGETDAYPKLESEKSTKLIPRINDDIAAPNPTHAIFEMAFPETDLKMNPHLSEEPREYDLSQFNY